MCANDTRRFLGVGIAVTALLLLAPISAQNPQYWRLSSPKNIKFFSTALNNNCISAIHASKTLCQTRDNVCAHILIAAEKKDVVERAISPCKGAASLDPKLVADLITWIVKKTGWPVRDPPLIRFVPASQIQNIASRRTGAYDAHFKALYGFDNHTIYLPNEWTPFKIRDRAVLLHELVHHLQALNKVQVECEAAYERQAYHLTIEWLREQGVVNPYKLLNIDEFDIHIFSLCIELE